MESPISQILNFVDNNETRPLKMGAHVFQITMPKTSWFGFEKLDFCGYDVESILDFCADNLIFDDPSKTLQQYLYWIRHEKHASKGLVLKFRDGTLVPD